MIKDENKTIEFKSEFKDEIMNEIIAFLNTNGGTIYVGINDDKTINKAFLNSNKKESELKLSNWIETIIFPSAFGLVDYKFTENGILVINVLEGHKKPYYLKGKGPKPVGVYKRVGSTTRKASEEEIMIMLLDSRNYVYENEISENQKLTFKYLIMVFKEKNISFTKRNQMALGLIDPNGFYTNLALILSDQSEITVKLAEYDKNMNFKIKKEFKGCLIKIFQEVEEQVKRLNDTAAVIDGKTFERREQKSYPEVSLREIILNAFCHTNYMIKSNIKIEFFQNHVKITSPGGIYLASMEEIMAGIQTYRNPKLVRILDKLKFIENYGTGILRTKQEYKKYKMQPEFQDIGNFFVVKLPNLNYIFSTDQSGDEIKLGDEINETKSDEIKLGDEINETKSDEIKSGDEIDEDKSDEIKLGDEINETKSDEIKSGDEINEDKSDEIKLGDEINETKSDEIKLGDEINEAKSDEIKLGDEINEAKSDEIKLGDEIKEAKSDEIKSGDEINETKSDEIKLGDEIKEAKSDEIKLADEINETKSDEIKLGDEINETKSDEINEEIKKLREAILITIKKNPGIKVQDILEHLVCIGIYTSTTTIQNQLRRKLSKYIVYKGSKKTGGYYYKNNVK